MCTITSITSATSIVTTITTTTTSINMTTDGNALNGNSHPHKQTQA